MAKWRFEEDLADFKPVDKTRWGMSPQTVNAYYNASYNEIVFPAAILQPPFYNYADEAVNYGGIGGYWA
jgi:endothelin-converting enzyme/putative endopeptidase